MAVDHHHTFVAETAAGPGLYVVGGHDGNRARAEVYRAAIREDGMLDAFEPAGMLPQGRAGAALFVSGSTVVLAGGAVQGAVGGLSHTNSVVVGELADDGTLGSFTEGPMLPGVRFHPSGSVHGERLYLSGGVTSNGQARGEIFVSTLTDGALSPWRTAATLEVPRSHHASLIVNDTLLLIGGLTGNPFQNATTTFSDVIAADIATDGSLSDFEVRKGDVGFALSTHAATLGNGCIFVVGGGAGEGFVANDVVYRVDDAIARQAEALDERLPMALTHRHHAPLYGTSLYAVAGSLNHVGSDRVFVGRFDVSSAE